MKLWLVVLIFNEVAAAWGPMPRDLDRCQAFVGRMVEEVRAGVLKGAEVRIRGRTVTVHDIDARCVYSDARPEKGTVLQQDRAAISPR